jgi:ABC-type phosphate/phosphonate transport system permease subunit
MVASSLSTVNFASAAIALASLLAYLLSFRTTARSAARDEALALAETRAQTILDLRRSVDDLVDALVRVRGDLEEAPPDVERALARIRRRVRDAEVWSRVD